MRWEEIRHMPTIMVALGQLVVVINNGGMHLVPEDTSNFGIPPKQLRTLMVVSSPIFIKARDQNEMNAIDETFSKPGKYNKGDLEHIIPIMTPGTLQNLLKYQLLLLELEQHFGEELDELKILEALENMENFLQTLHEIERENLKRFVENRKWLEERMRNNEKLLNKFTEVFGEKPVPVKRAGGMGSGGM